jgi:hypothetical protein
MQRNAFGEWSEFLCVCLRYGASLITARRVSRSRARGAAGCRKNVAARTEFRLVNEKVSRGHERALFDESLAPLERARVTVPSPE